MENEKQQDLAAVESRDEEDVVPGLYLIGFFALKLPVCVVDENQNAWTAIQCAVS